MKIINTRSFFSIKFRKIAICHRHLFTHVYLKNILQVAAFILFVPSLVQAGQYCNNQATETLTCIEEYHPSTEKAAKACVDFAAANGYSGWCHGNAEIAEAGWLCVPRAPSSDSCSAADIQSGNFHFYLGVFAHPTCSNGYTPNPFTGVCELPPQNLGSGCPNTSNPIGIGTGNKWLTETDIQNSVGSFSFERQYNSASRSEKLELGKNWNHTYSRSLSLSQTGLWLLVNRQNGKSYKFSLTGANWLSDSGITDKLIEIKNEAAVRTGWRYTVDSTGEIEVYDATGKLLSITDRTGFVQTMVYSCKSVSTVCPVVTPDKVANTEGLLINVTDSLGRSLDFSYDNQNRMASLTNPQGGMYTYAYDSNQNLASVTYPDGKVKTYHYENTTFKNALTGIRDENNVRFATYSYDSVGRATSEFHAGNVDNNTLEFNADETGNLINTVVTDALGSKRTYNFTTILGVVKSTGQSQPGGAGCSASSSNITYDANGNVASRTDFDGHKTTYAYNLARNLETSRTEGLNTAGVVTPATRTITTTWHPKWQLPLEAVWKLSDQAKRFNMIRVMAI